MFHNKPISRLSRDGNRHLFRGDLIRHSLRVQNRSLSRSSQTANESPVVEMSSESSSSSSSSEETLVEDVLESSSTFRGLAKEEYYHGLLPAEDALKLLSRNGDFLLRIEEADDGSGKKVCMSVRWQSEGFNFAASTSPRGCTFDGFHYASHIGDLIRQHKTQSIGLNNKGVIPLNAVHRQEWELRHDQVTLTKKLGEGAFGEVHLGVLQIANDMKVRVAVKQSKGDVNKEQIEEMMREARLMRQYKHRNIVRFYGVAAEKEPVMIIMEFVGGGALDSYIKKGIGSITPTQKAGMCYGAAAGLNYLHEHGCIHRDVAARNCLISKKDHHVKISDFGLSTKSRKHVMDRNERAPIRWLAPEVISTALYEQSADIWSFGVMCWEVFADGETPYKEFTTADLQKRIHEPDFRLVMRADTPKDVVKIVEACWIAHPQSRPPMSAVVAGLKKYSPDERHSKKKRKKGNKKASSKKKNNKPKVQIRETGVGASSKSSKPKLSSPKRTVKNSSPSERSCVSNSRSRGNNRRRK